MGQDFDVIVVGAGSGGIGAALAAARHGLNVCLVEKHSLLGGTAVLAEVCVWEMGAGGTGLPFEIYRRLRKIPNSVGVYSIGRHCLWPSPDEIKPYPGGESTIDPQRCYIDTLRRYGAKSMAEDEAFVRAHWHGVPFEPLAYARVVEEMLYKTEHCTVLKNTKVTGTRTKGSMLKAVKLSGGPELTAETVIDATGNGIIARLCGLETMFGQEPRSRFNEPDAPLKKGDHLNGATLIYRVTPRSGAAVDPLPADIPENCWWDDRFPTASITQLPCGDLHINMLPTMAGIEVVELGEEKAYDACQRRVYAHWHRLQMYAEEFQGYQIKWTALQLGVRESWRVLGEYVLTENDLLAGISGQSHDDIVTIADHAMDTHGRTTGRGGCGELREPYGIPYRCLIPKGMDNLLIACRAASFSSLAASSARLSRTMMQLGQAAGTAAALAHDNNINVSEVPAILLQEDLRTQHVQLDHPMPDALKRYIMDDDIPE